MVDGAPMAIPAKRKARKERHIPPEIVEQILLNLPVKSLLRFTSVTKLWNSMISDAQFIALQKNHHNSYLVVIVSAGDDMYDFATLCAFSSISLSSSSSSSDLPPREIKMQLKYRDDYVSANFSSRVTDFAGQFKKETPYPRALCDELWCVEVRKHLFLWNPSIRSYRKLPPPLFKGRRKFEFEYLYGLGYDSVGDDYKILRVNGRVPDPSSETEVYSLKHNCWRRIEPYSSAQPCSFQRMCEFVSGKFHWIGVTAANTPVIVSFNLSTEKYGELTLPQSMYSSGLRIYFMEDEEDEDEGEWDDEMEVVVLRGKLCVFLNLLHEDNPRFELWVLEEYKDDKSWTKKFDFHHCNLRGTLKPVYYYDNDEILVKSYAKDNNGIEMMDLVLYNKEKGETTTWSKKKIVSCGITYATYYDADAFLYVETLISPATLYNTT